jgi:hypothetical protein
MPNDRLQPAPAGNANATPSAEAGHPAPERGRVPARMLWFGLVGGPAAWSVQTLVNLPLASHACFPALFPLATSETPGLRGLVFVVSIAAVLVSVAAAACAWRAWTRTRNEHQDNSGHAQIHSRRAAVLETGEGRTRFMALAGVLTSFTFILVSVIHLSSVFLVTPCGS